MASRGAYVRAMKRARTTSPKTEAITNKTGVLSKIGNFFAGKTVVDNEANPASAYNKVRGNKGFGGSSRGYGEE